jgi:hypothetical protein
MSRRKEVKTHPRADMLPDVILYAKGKIKQLSLPVTHLQRKCIKTPDCMKIGKIAENRGQNTVFANILESPPKTLFPATDLLRGCKAEYGSQQVRRRRLPVVLEGESQRCLDFLPGKNGNLSGCIATYEYNPPIKHSLRPSWPDKWQFASC